MKYQHCFKAYESIDNHYHTAKKLVKDPNYDPQVQWTVSEKIHGCNFSFIVWKEEKGVMVQVASRRMILDEESVKDFFPEAVSIVRKRYEELIVKMFEKIMIDYSTDTFIVRRLNVFGEM